MQINSKWKSYDYLCLFEMKFILRQQTIRVCPSKLYVRFIKARDESCVITDSFDDFTTGNFLCYKERKRLKWENVLLFKLLLEMKFILMC